jgi:Big-like domain-containing protein
VITGRHFSRFHPVAVIAAALALTGSVFAQCTNTEVPGKFYEYYIIAQTGSCNGNTFTSLGANPAINDFGLVGFMGQSSALSGSALWVGDGHMHPAANPINPGEVGSSEIYDGAVQLGNSLSNVQLVTKDSITTTSPATTSIRVWNTATPDSYRYASRGGPGQKFGAVFPFPSINKNGETAFCALDSNNPTIKYLVEVSPTGGVSKTAVNVSVGEPMLDDNGDVLLYQLTTVPSGGFQVMLYPKGLGTPEVIADYNNFTSIDSAPGISHDGLVVAFQGNLNTTGATAYSTTPGPGIFAATYEGGSVWHITRVTNIMVETPNSGGNNNGICDPGETCQPGAELGYDETGNAIYFKSTGYGVGTRVGVMNLGLGAAGIDDDSFVISFVGTPTEASRDNPVLKNGTPLFFSAQQGLWTIRVDVQKQLSPPNGRVYHPRTAIPVVQIGDKVSGNVVNAIGAYDDIANAAKDETGNIRTMRRGDHRVAFWASTAGGTQFIARANHLDSDQDGLLDHWETTGIDMDQDGIVDLNLAAMGANPTKRDLFLEIDWIAKQPGSSYTFAPAAGVVSPVAYGSVVSPSPLVGMFKAAPALTGDEYGVRIDGSNPANISAGIALHIDGGRGNAPGEFGGPQSVNMGTGPLDGGGQVGLSGNSSGGLPELIYFGKPNSLTIPGVDTRNFQDVKDNFFGSQDKDGRELAFHYALFADYYQADSDTAGKMSWDVASAGTRTLTSASPLPSMPVDQNGHTGAGEILKITGGKGAGQYRIVQYKTVNPNQVQLLTPWTTIPDDTSTFSVLSGSTGLSELFINPDPDDNSLPGNDLMVTFGSNLVPPYTTPNGVLGTACEQWRTLAHEFGHTLGLRHGGIDNNAYKGQDYLSLMSYSWQLECDSTVVSYSDSNTTFDDWANLQGNFSDSEMHLGNTSGLSFGTFPEVDQYSREQNFNDYLNQNGPIDSTPPVVAITSPAAGANEGIGSPMVVTVTATDNVAVALVGVSFDVNGNGTIDSGEQVLAKASGTNTYKATFPALSGPAGARTITATAGDFTGNAASATLSVNVEQPNPVPSIASLLPPNATHGGAGFTLTVNGANFVSGCTVEWNGKGVSTAFVNSGQVSGKITAADIATAGTATVTVKNPAPGGGVSNSKAFTIN